MSIGDALFDDVKFATLAALRPVWDELIAEQRRFVHVPNHATHHRSEIATILTMLNDSPPDTGINSYYRETAT